MKVTGSRGLIQRIPLSLRYGIVIAAGLILLKTLEYQLFSYRFNLELYTGLLALFFMLVGLAAGLGWLNRNASPTTEHTTNPVLQEDPLTVKEQHLLQGLAIGLTNQQLADSHHLSVNTVKTHLKSIYRKLEVSSRAQAVARAKNLNLLAPAKE